MIPASAPQCAPVDGRGRYLQSLGAARHYQEEARSRYQNGLRP